MREVLDRVVPPAPEKQEPVVIPVPDPVPDDDDGKSAAPPETDAPKPRAERKSKGWWGMSGVRKLTKMSASMDDLSVEFQPDRQRYVIRHGQDETLMLDETEVIWLRHMLGFMVPDWRGDD